MRYLLVDDESIALKNMEAELRDLFPDSEIYAFEDSDAALAWISQNHADIALLDISMGQLDGLTLAKMIQDACPSCAIVFTTGFSDYAVDAFRLHANGYLMKPVDPDDLREEILRIQRTMFPAAQHRIRIQCFGNFEVFVDGKILNFHRQKSKELLAYLVDRHGAGVSMAEIAAILWEDGIYDKSRNRQIHVFLHDLKQAFAAANVQDIIVRQHNTLAVNCNCIHCDYYDYLIGDEKAVSTYYGEYMTQYSWAETTNGSLLSLL